MKRVNTLNNYIRVSTTRVGLIAVVFSMVVAGGLIGCSDRDNQARTIGTTQDEADTRFESDEVRASQRDLNGNQYSSDNTGLNARDQNSANRTADNQAMGGDETEILADIRREIVANDDMSTYAKNVKIIVKDGTVTLRGPVDSLNEKQWIGRTTTARARNFRVINQLEVREQS